MSGWLFVLAVTLLMVAVFYFAWVSDSSAIADEQDAETTGDAEREAPPTP